MITAAAEWAYLFLAGYCGRSYWLPLLSKLATPRTASSAAVDQTRARPVAASLPRRGPGRLPIRK